MQFTKNLLKRLDSFIQEVNRTNKTNEKLEIIKNYEDLKEIFVYVNDTQLTYGITSKNYKKYIKSGKSKNFKNYMNLYTLLDDLSERKITGDCAASSLKNFILQFPEYEEIILRVIDKNLKTRTNTKAINKVFPGLIKTFDVTLAEKYKESKINKNSKYFISRKLDGVRCICFFENYGKSIKFYSRAGNRFVDKNGNCTLKELYKPLRKTFYGIETVVLDGEICKLNVDGSEDFQKVVSEIRTHVYKPCYYIFDMLTKTEFEEGKGSRKFEKRLARLKTYEDIEDSIKILNQIEMSKENFEKMKQQSIENGWEGLMIKKNVGYKNGRSYDLMKFKDFFDEEFTVTNIITGPFRCVKEINGRNKEITINTMTAVEIDFYSTKVGSGFTLEERERYFKHPEEIIGKKITVQYFEKTKNKDNNDLSLRFPTFKGIRDYE